MLTPTEHNFLPDFIWGLAGGIVVLIFSALFLFLTFKVGGASSPTYYRELAGLFLAGYLVVLVARSLTAQAR